MRGGLFDSVIIGAIILAMLIGSMFSVYIYYQITDKVEETLVDKGALDQATADEIFGGSDTAVNTFSNLIIVIVFFLYLASLVTSYLTKNNPIFIFFSMLFVAIGIILTVIEKNVYDNIVVAVPTIAAQIPLASWYFNNSTIIVAVFGGLNLLVAYLAYQMDG